MRLSRFIRILSPRGVRPTLVILDETNDPTVPPRPTQQLTAADEFLVTAQLVGVALADAQRVADCAVYTAARYGCSHRMLLESAAQHLSVGREPVDVVMSLITSEAAVSYAAVIRGSQ